MKKILILCSIVISIGCMSVQAKSLTNDERVKWEKIGIWQNGEINRWIDAGFKSPHIVNEWIDAGIVNPRNIQELKDEANITTIAEFKRWSNAGIDNLHDIKNWQKIGINNPTQAKAWKQYIGFDPMYAKEWIDVKVTNPKEAAEWSSVGISPSNIDNVKKLNLDSKKILAWRKVGVGYADDVIKMMNKGFSSPETYKTYKALGVTTNNIAEVKKAGLDIRSIELWNKYGAKDIKHILLLKNGGFESPDDYKPYDKLFMQDAIKLHKWGIEPNSLIESMSITSGIANEEIFFDNESKFRKAYETIEDECDNISRKKWFSDVDISQNEGKCFMFASRMMQRLDEKSFFGKVTQNGLAIGIKNRYFYVEDFTGSWMEQNTRIGIIKGIGSFSYNSTGAKRIVSKGKIVYVK
ncbi:hypothetical protein [Sulfurimonas sp.]|uniref:hypothetical protein n=1 Tax=Sulfurimonas sp. TaxID=2022749 RepID=UPI0035636F8B